MSVSLNKGFGVRMRKFPLIMMLVLVLCMGSAFADSSTVTIASIVDGNPQVNPSIVIGLSSAQLTYFVSPEQETTVISGLDLTEDGSFTFAMMTSDEVFIYNEAQKYGLTIEIVADGFHLYDYEGETSSDNLTLKQKYAVPLLTSSPEVEIPEFQGANENVSVYHSGGANRIEVQFNKGMTKADLILGTFSISWKGKSPLDEGVYKARVSVVYSTP